MIIALILMSPFIALMLVMLVLIICGKPLPAQDFKSWCNIEFLRPGDIVLLKSGDRAMVVCIEPGWVHILIFGQENSGSYHLSEFGIDMTMTEFGDYSISKVIGHINHAA